MLMPVNQQMMTRGKAVVGVTNEVQPASSSACTSSHAECLRQEALVVRLQTSGWAMRICCCCTSTDSENTKSGSALNSQSSGSEHAKLQSLSEHKTRDQTDRRRSSGSPYVKVKSAHVRS